MAKAAATAVKSMTKSDMSAQLAETVGISKKQVGEFFDAFAQLAYKQAKNTFTIPGLGKLKLRERPARKMMIRFGANAGKEQMIPKKKVVKFSVSKAAKDSILGLKK